MYHCLGGDEVGGSHATNCVVTGGGEQICA